MQQMQQGLVRASVLAEEMKITTGTIMAWIRRGELPESAVKKIGKFWYVSRPQFMAWFEDRALVERKRGGRQTGSQTGKR